MKKGVILIIGIILVLLVVGNFLYKNNQEIGYYCEQGSDCILEIDSCPLCFPCEFVSINEKRVIATNRSYCPPIPEDTICVACVGSRDYDSLDDAECINNKCTKAPQMKLLSKKK